MAQGVLSGIGLGALFSIGAAGVISVLVPVEPQPAPEVGTAGSVAAPQQSAPQSSAVVTTESGEAPSQPNVTLRAPIGEDLPKEPAPAAQAPQVATNVQQAETAVVLPDVRVDAPALQTAPLAPRPVPLAVLESDAGDSTPRVPDPLPAQPRAGDADGLTAPDALPDVQSAQVQPVAPVLPNPQALAPMIPDASRDSELAEQSSTPAQPPVQSDAEDALQDAAQGEEILVVVPDLPQAEPEPEAEAAPQTDVADAPQAVEQEPEAEQQPVLRPRVVPAPGTRVATLGTNARPRVGTPATTLINRTDDAASAPVETVTQAAPTDPSQLPPVQRYSKAFENPDAKPLMSILLIDSGADLDAAEIGLPALSSFPYPISFAVNVSLPDAAERMQRYRAEGFEVMAMLDLPPAAQPTDAEVSLAVALNGLPEVIGVLEGTGEGLQGTREVADQVTGILRASGHGLVTQSKGLNSMPKLAVKEGVPAAPVFRDFDSQGQQPRVIRRFLDQAAFKAGQEGGVIMLGRLRPETIEALLVWGLADRAGSVALAPVSAVLQAQR